MKSGQLIREKLGIAERVVVVATRVAATLGNGVLILVSVGLALVGVALGVSCAGVEVARKVGWVDGAVDAAVGRSLRATTGSGGSVTTTIPAIVGWIEHA